MFSFAPFAFFAVIFRVSIKIDFNREKTRKSAKKTLLFSRPFAILAVEIRKHPPRLIFFQPEIPFFSEKL
jgi:hypothetical protein